MTSRELIKSVAQKTGVDTTTVQMILKTTFSTIKRNCKKHKTVEIKSFGTFQPIGHWNGGIESDEWYCKLRKIERNPLTVGYAPEQWSHIEFYPTRDWKTFDEKWVI